MQIPCFLLWSHDLAALQKYDHYYDSAYSYTFFRSVVCLSVVCRLSHSYTPLKPFDGFWCHSAGTLVGSSDILYHCQMAVPDLQREGEILWYNPQPEHAIYDSPGGSIDLRFRLIPNYIGACCIIAVAFSGVAGPLAAQGGGQICRPFVLDFFLKLESLFKV